MGQGDTDALDSNGSIFISGGTVEGSVVLEGGNEVHLSGTPQFAIAPDGETASAYGLDRLGAVTIDCDNLSADAKVVLTNLGSLTVTGTGDERAFNVLDTTTVNKIGDDTILVTLRQAVPVPE